MLPGIGIQEVHIGITLFDKTSRYRMEPVFRQYRGDGAVGRLDQGETLINDFYNDTDLAQMFLGLKTWN